VRQSAFDAGLRDVRWLCKIAQISIDRHILQFMIKLNRRLHDLRSHATSKNDLKFAGLFFGQL
jgi:hypothetical protein